MTEQELIERLERATGPDRELANDVLFACGWSAHEIGMGDVRSTVWTSPDGHDHLDGDHPDPTRSLDAALTLVPGGWAWSVHSESIYATGHHKDPRAELAQPVETQFGPGFGIRAQINAKTPAIALCIAALKARAASERDMEAGR